MSLISELGPILFLAAVLGLLAARLGQPPLLGYIAAGITAGSGAFGIIWHEETIRAFGDLGIVLLLFYLGLELSWHRMKPIAGRSVLLALTITGVPFLVLVNILLLAGLTGITPAVIAFILSINSTAIAVQALEARGLFSGRLAGLVIGSNLVVDILAIVALTALGVGHGASEHDGGHSLGEVLLRTAGFVAACATVGLAVVPRALDSIHAHRASRLLMPVALIATGLMVAFAGERLGVPLSVGAFVAGILAAESKAREELVACLDPIKELFLGVFFVAVGFQVSLGSLVAMLPWALAAALVVAIVRFLSVTATAYASGEEAALSLQLAAVLVPIGEFSFLLAMSPAIEPDMQEKLTSVIILMMFLLSLGVEPLLAAAPAFEKNLSRRSPGALRHLLYIVRGALAPATSPYAPAKNPVRGAFRDLVLTLIVMVGVGVGIGGTSNWLNVLTPHWLRFDLLGVLIGTAVIVPGFYLLATRWRNLLKAMVGADKEGPGAERVRRIQRATRATLTTLALGLLVLALLPLVLTALEEIRPVAIVLTVLVGLILAFLFRRAVLRLHSLLGAGLTQQPAAPTPPPTVPDRSRVAQ